jgi:HK97 family phage major capsid protein
MGGRILQFTAERGRVSLPRISSSTIPGEVAEGSALGAQSNPTIDALTFVPHTIEAWTDVTRTMISSSWQGFDQFILGDQARALANRMDAIGLNGSGTNTPAGILNTSSIPIVSMGTNGAAPTRAAMISVESAVSQALGDQGADASLYWCTTPQARTKMRGIDTSSAGSAMWLWDNNEKILSWPGMITSNMPSAGTKGSGTALSSLIFGDWRSLLINVFGDAIDVLVNPYLQSTSGLVRITSFLDIDVAVAHLASFCVISDLVTT